MKSIIVIQIVLIGLTLSCNTAIVNKFNTKECKEYYQFVIDNRESTEHWIPERFKKYHNEKCLLGLKEKEIIRLFGVPPKEFTINTQQKHIFVYGLREGQKCDPHWQTIHQPTSLIFYFDKSGKVVEVVYNPPKEKKSN